MADPRRGPVEHAPDLPPTSRIGGGFKPGVATGVGIPFFQELGMGASLGTEPRPGNGSGARS